MFKRTASYFVYYTFKGKNSLSQEVRGDGWLTATAPKKIGNSDIMEIGDMLNKHIENTEDLTDVNAVIANIQKLS